MDPDPFRDQVAKLVDDIVPVQDVSRLILSYYGRGTLGFIISKDSGIQSRIELDPSNTQVLSYDSGKLIDLVALVPFTNTLELFPGLFGFEKWTLKVAKGRIWIPESRRVGYVLQNPQRIRLDLAALRDVCVCHGEKKGLRIDCLGRFQRTCFQNGDLCYMCHEWVRAGSRYSLNTTMAELFPDDSKTYFRGTAIKWPVMCCVSCLVQHGLAMSQPPKKLFDLRHRYQWEIGLPLSMVPIDPLSRCFFPLDTLHLEI